MLYQNCLHGLTAEKGDERMGGKLMQDKVCPNHPENQAVTRCTTCFKPLCGACVVEKGNMDFCSDQCATNHFTTNASISDSLARDAAARRRKRIVKLFLLLVLLAMGFAGAFYWRNYMSSKNKKGVLDNLKQGSKKVGRALENSGEKMKKLAD